MGVDPKFINTYAKFLKIIGEENRLKIIFSLQKEEKSVSEIMGITNISQSLVSFHLKILRENKLIKNRREKNFIYYSLINKELIKDLINLSKHLKYLQIDNENHDFQWPFWKNCCLRKE